MKRILSLWLVMALAVLLCAPALSETAGEEPVLPPAAEEPETAAPELPPAENEQETAALESPPAEEEPAAEEKNVSGETGGQPDEALPAQEQSAPPAEDPPEQPQEEPSDDQEGPAGDPAAADVPETEVPGASETAPLAETPDGEDIRKEGETPAGQGAEDPPAPETVSELSKAVNLKLSSSGLWTIVLTFKGDTAPTGYKVYRATKKTGKYSSIGNAWEPVPGSGEYRYEDSTAKKGVAYYYKVRGFVNGEEGTRWGAYSSVVSGKTKPASVGKVTGQSISSTSLKISWSKVSGASGYQISRSTNLNSGYKVLATAGGKTVSYTDKAAKVGTQYYYRVRAFYTPADGSGKIYGPYSYSSAILCEPTAPKNFKVSGHTDTSVTLAWTVVTGAKYYKVRYSWVEDGKTQTVTTDNIPQKQKSLTIGDRLPGQELTFQIWTVVDVTGKEDWMRSGSAECRFTMPGTPVSGNGADGPQAIADGEDGGLPGTDTEEPAEEEPLLPEEDEGPILEKDLSETVPSISGCDITIGGVQLFWTGTAGAVSYRVERSSKQNSGYKTIAEGIAAEEFLDTTAVATKAYFYRIVATDSMGTETAGQPKGIFASTALTITSKRGSDGYYTLTWPARKNAEEYRIYRSVNGGSFSQVKKIPASSARSWKDSNVSAGNTYDYYVRAWKTADGKKVAGAKGNIKSIYVGVKENPAVTVTQDAGKISLSWNRVQNASGYIIYGAKGDNQLKELARVSASATSWSQTPPAASGYLKYYVRAYAVVGSKKKFAPASDPVVIRRLAPPQITVERGTDADTLEVRWSAVSGAQSYRVYYRRNPEEDYQYIETEERFAVIPAQGGSTASVYVQALCTEEGKSFIGSRSGIKSCTPYWKFALLIGNSQYTSKSNLRRLAMCAADVTGISVVLDRQNGWNVSVCANLNGSEIQGAISRFFRDANENSTCLFYYSGHGNNSHTETTGSIYGTDGSFVTTAELKASLNQVPGKMIVLLDSCGSGAVVENESGADTLEEDKYSVLTASEAYELSYANPFHSYFSYYLSFGSGWDYDARKALATQPADADRDGTVTLQEMCSYILDHLKTSTLTTKLPEPDAPLY